jgi:hypothetical protein
MKKKLVEVALSLEAVNVEAARWITKDKRR